MARKKKEEPKTILKEEASYVVTWYGKNDEVIKREYSKDRMTAENKRLDWIIESVNNGDRVTAHTNPVITTKECKFVIERIVRE